MKHITYTQKFALTTFKYLFALSAFISCCNMAQAQSWTAVGSLGFSAAQMQNTSIAIDASGTPYVAYLDYADSGKATVMKYTDVGWVTVGNEGFSEPGIGVNSTSIAIDSHGNPYVAYSINVSSGFTGGPVSVMMYNGSSWVAVGSLDFSAGGTYFTTLAIGLNDTPYVAYEDFVNDFKATVMKYNGTNWVPVGSPGISAAQALYTSIAISSTGIPYVAFVDDTDTVKTTVMMYTGGNWQNVGGEGMSAGGTNYTAMAIDNSGTPYVVYEDYINGYRATVMKYNGTNWVNVGIPGFSADTVTYTDIAIDNTGNPYVTYVDWANGQKATTMRFNGTSWVNVGDPGFTSSYAINPVIAINSGGTPYVAFSDAANGSKASVMEYLGGDNVAKTASTITSQSIFPDPNEGTFTIYISSTIKENATITITNILGEKIEEVATMTNINTPVKLTTPPGIYFISTVTKTNSLTSKFEIK